MLGYGVSDGCVGEESLGLMGSVQAVSVQEALRLEVSVQASSMPSCYQKCTSETLKHQRRVTTKAVKVNARHVFPTNITIPVDLI